MVRAVRARWIGLRDACGILTDDQAPIRENRRREKENTLAERNPMIELRTPAEIEAMRPAGRFVAETLVTLRDETRVGTNLLAIDQRAHDLIRRAGAESCYIDYHPSFGASPFGKVICTSVNDAVLHGLPFDYDLRDGDLVSLDFAVSVDGWVADSAVSFVVGTPRDEDLKLIETTERALDAAIAAATVGNRIGDVSAAIAGISHGAGYSINTDFGGHGVGRIMHGDPHVPNDGKAGRGYPLRAGLVVALEPWLLASTDQLVTDPDGWTLRSVDGSRGAHSEHTVAVTAAGPIVLTDRSFLGVD
jgi:methionyl aminopeptidase